VSVVEWLAAFVWTLGECFKCESSGVPVTAYGAMEGPRGTVRLFTCQSCTFRMECRYSNVLAGTHRPAIRPLRSPEQFF